MERDFRTSTEFKATETFYNALFAPGGGHVYAAPEVVVAPNGTQAYITGLSFRGNLEDGPSGGVYRIDLATGALAAVHGSAARLPRPSPDGARIAFVASDGGERLLIAEADGSAPAVGAPAIDGTIESVEWSADSRSLLLLVAGRGADLAGYQGGYATTAAAEDGPAWLPEVTTGQEAFLWRRLWLLDVGSGALRPVSAETTNVWEASWCGPDLIAAVRSSHHGEGSWYASTLVVIDAADGAERELYRPADQIGLPAGSPDGRHVAFVEAVCSDRGIVCGQLKVASVQSGGARALNTGGVECTSLAWRNSATVHFAGQEAFETVVGDVDLDASDPVELWRSAELTCGEWYPSAKPLPDGKSLIVAEAYNRPPHLAVLSVGGFRQVKSLATAGAHAAMADCGAVAPVRWSAPDGLEIHGWLVTPHGAAHGPLPLVIDIHGGPVWANRNRWLGRLRATPLLVRLGCAVLYPNPRGSSCRGQDFARMVKGDMGGADTGDFISAIDHFVAQGLVDETKVACTGTSYGGFMSAWLVTQDRRFAAAAPISPVSDWFSQHRTSQIPYFDEIFLDDSASNPSGRFFTRSPAMYADRVVTPCLVMAGALDKNTPPGQALEFYQSLIEHGVDSALVTYPRDGHSLRGYPAYIDTAARILSWFAPRLGLANAAPASPSAVL
jgi:dipeptidyl aminopeptidase/acylaminoacyl peptidase